MTPEAEQAPAATMETARPRKGRWRDLNTVEDVRRHMARACRLLERKRITPEQGRAMVYALKALAQLMLGADSEARIAALEEELIRLRAGHSSGVRRASYAELETGLAPERMGP